MHSIDVCKHNVTTRWHSWPRQCIARQATAAELKAAACAAAGAEEVDVDLWEMWNGEKLHMLENQLDSTLDTIPILDGQTILLQDKAGLASQPNPRLG